MMKLFWKICCLRAGPQQVPYSIALLAIAILLSCILGWYQLSFRSSVADALWQALLMLGTTVLFTFIILYFRKSTERFIQTITALIACGVVIHATALPLHLLQPYLLQTPLPKTVAMLLSLISLIFILVINVWNLLVNAHIFRHALNVSQIAALLVTLGLIGFNILIFSQLVGHS